MAGSLENESRQQESNSRPPDLDPKTTDTSSAHCTMDSGGGGASGGRVMAASPDDLSLNLLDARLFSLSISMVRP